MEGTQEQHENSELVAQEPRVRGRPFQPGQSGNPGGRPQGSKSLRNLLIEALRQIAVLVRDFVPPERWEEVGAKIDSMLSGAGGGEAD